MVLFVDIGMLIVQYNGQKTNILGQRIKEIQLISNQKRKEFFEEISVFYCCFLELFGFVV